MNLSKETETKWALFRHSFTCFAAALSRKHDSKGCCGGNSILYGSSGSALSSTRSVSKLEKFGFLSSHLYAWTGFPIMWGIIAKTRVKKDGRKPKQLWHDLLDDFVSEFNGKEFFGGDKSDIVDIATFGIVRSISPFKQFKQIQGDC